LDSGVVRWRDAESFSRGQQGQTGYDHGGISVIDA
jgi:hypothetical protein